jgi:small ligand-binding sensory domain FIST
MAEQNTKQCQAAVAVSGHFDTRTAATEVAHRLTDAMTDGFDALFLFGSYHHNRALAGAAEILHNAINPTTILGCSAESVLGGDKELEGVAGLAVLALRLPGAALLPWRIDPNDHEAPVDTKEAARLMLALDTQARAAIMLVDPFSTPMARIMPPINDAIVDTHNTSNPFGGAVLVGGMASGASQPGHNVLILGEESYSTGVVGLTISGSTASGAGAVQVDALVSQGCRPIGATHVVTKSKGNVIIELGGRRAIDVVQETAGELHEDERSMLSGGLFIGIAVTEYKDRFGRGDFLIRNLLGFDQKAGAIAVADHVRIGQTVQFHMRDAETADEDLQLLLDAQQMDEPPTAALLFNCNGRGTRMFGEPHHDVTALRERLGNVPIAGFFAAGEIGPVGKRSYVHGHTACAALIRARCHS